VLAASTGRWEVRRSLTLTLHQWTAGQVDGLNVANGDLDVRISHERS